MHTDKIGIQITAYPSLCSQIAKLNPEVKFTKEQNIEASHALSKIGSANLPPKNEDSKRTKTVHPLVSLITNSEICYDLSIAQPPPQKRRSRKNEHSVPSCLLNSEFCDMLQPFNSPTSPQKRRFRKNEHSAPSRLLNSKF